MKIPKLDFKTSVFFQHHYSELVQELYLAIFLRGGKGCHVKGHHDSPHNVFRTSDQVSIWKGFFRGRRFLTEKFFSLVIIPGLVFPVQIPKDSAF